VDASEKDHSLTLTRRRFVQGVAAVGVVAAIEGKFAVGDEYLAFGSAESGVFGFTDSAGTGCLAPAGLAFFHKFLAVAYCSMRGNSRGQECAPERLSISPPAQPSS
jgi:hypothetical protein